MMKLQNKIIFFYITVFSLIYLSCSTSYDSVLGDYNSMFEIDYSDSITSDMLSPGDEGFNPKEMLLDEYFLGSDSSLFISAPPYSSSFDWRVSNPEDDTLIAITLFGNNYAQYVATDKVFSINARTCGLEEGETYKLTLQVTDQGGLLYTDTCALVIYKRYNFY